MSVFQDEKNLFRTSVRQRQRKRTGVRNRELKSHLLTNDLIPIQTQTDLLPCNIFFSFCTVLCTNPVPHGHVLHIFDTVQQNNHRNMQSKKRITVNKMK